MLDNSRNANISEHYANDLTDEELLITQILEKAQDRFVVFYTKARTIQFRNINNVVLHEFATWQDTADFLNNL